MNNVADYKLVFELISLQFSENMTVSSQTVFLWSTNELYRRTFCRLSMLKIEELLNFLH